MLYLAWTGKKAFIALLTAMRRLKRIWCQPKDDLGEKNTSIDPKLRKALTGNFLNLVTPV
jgi:hypothetical protein